MSDIQAPHSSSLRVAGAAVTARAHTLRQLFSPHRGRFVAGCVVLVITALLQLLLPSLVNLGVDLAEGRAAREALPEGGDLAVPLLWGMAEVSVWQVATLLVAIALLAALARTGSRVLLFQVGRDVERDLRAALFAHLAVLSPSFYQGRSTGDLMSRLTNDLSNIRLLAGFALLNACNALLFFVGNLPLMLAIDVTVTIAALIPFPLVMLLSRMMSRSMYRRTRENQEMLGKLTSAVQENLAGQHVVRAFSQEAAEQGRFERVNEEAYGAAMRLAWVRLLMFPLTTLMLACGVALTLWLAGRAVVEGRMDIGDFVEFNARLYQLSWPTIALGFILSVYQRGRASLERVNEVLSVAPDVVDGPHTGRFQGAVEARELQMRYPGAQACALEDVSFTLRPGQTLGIVGRNASGKTSLVRALARLCPVEPGQLSFDGVDANAWHLRDLRDAVAIVPDDGFLFSDTLRENLRFGRPDASEAEVEAMVDLVDLRRDVAAFPQGLDTLVGERGVMLSGGQRQRVALARALLARPHLLLLDDCLSAVDAETESRIVAALRAGAFSGEGASTATLVVSHRLSAVREADEILVLEQGRVLERGTHGELLARGGRYADLWGREQMARALEEAQARAGHADDAARAPGALEGSRAVAPAGTPT